MKIYTRLAALAGFATLFAGAATGTASAAAVNYQITVCTGNVPNAGTDANVEIRVNGSLGSSPFVPLDNPGNDRERNTCDVYPFTFADLGTLQSVNVFFDHSGLGADWFLTTVRVKPGSLATATFPYNVWLTSAGIFTRTAA